MGATNSIPQEELDELLVLTNFHENELQRWFVRFIKDYPIGYVTRANFEKIYDTIYQQTACTKNHIVNHLFRLVVNCDSL